MRDGRRVDFSQTKRMSLHRPFSRVQLVGTLFRTAKKKKNAKQSKRVISNGNRSLAAAADVRALDTRFHKIWNKV